jgi:hypothetical protein
MLQLVNQSPFAPLMSVLADETGLDTLYVVVKGTFTLTASPAIAAKQVEPTPGDVYWGDPATTSLKYAAEVHAGKRGTDVALLGHAHAPNERPVPEMFVAIKVADRQKAIRVVGERSWRPMRGGITKPEPFTKIPLVYERAFGGRHDDGRGHVLVEERNPVGVGFRGKRSEPESVACKVPNLEDVNQPLKSFGDRPPPAGFGFVAPAWPSRLRFAGTYDAAWQKDRAPFLPKDFDKRFLNAAAADLVFDRFLEGGEPLSLMGASPAGPIQSSIPKARPLVRANLDGRWVTLPTQLETVIVEPDDGRLCISWRGSLPCDKRTLKIRSIFVTGGA